MNPLDSLPAAFRLGDLTESNTPIQLDLFDDMYSISDSDSMDCEKV